jgi:hypothetical protein
MGLLASDPTWQRTRLKSADGAVDVLVQLAKQTLINEAKTFITPDIQNWYNAFVKANGERPNITGYVDGWDDAFDDELLELFEPFVDTLSGSWLNEVTTDARLWLPGEVERLANKFAQETWKQLTWQRSNKQILSGVGIVASDLAQFGELAKEPETPPQPEFKPHMINAIINRIMLSMPDPATLADNLDMASDDDDGLAFGAAQRLGIDQSAIVVMRQAREAGAKIEDWCKAIEDGALLDESTVYQDLSGRSERMADQYGPGVADALAKQEPDLGPDLPANLVRNALPPLPPPPVGTLKGALQASVNLPPLPPLPGTVPPPPAVAVGAAPPTNSGRGGKRTRTPEAPPAGHIAKEVLLSIKEHAGFKDEDFAGILGISRPTLANIMKGKGWYVPPDQSRRDALRTTLALHVQKLSEALNAVNA